MTQENDSFLFKFRLFTWLPLAFYLSSIFFLCKKLVYTTVFNVQVQNLLLCHTLFLAGLSLNVGYMLVQRKKQRYAWLPIPFLCLYAALLGREWLQVLA